ncbi:hypothetical protein O0L34_g14382 [Tuta absoluta]|nr:hypothetical protein O0L34_g14382 [Tuta absoluta]
MNVIFKLTLTLTLLVLVDAQKNATILFKIDDILNTIVNVNEPRPHLREGGKDSKLENIGRSGGHHINLLDLHGTMRERFIYAVTTTDERVSVVSSPFSALMPLGILLFATEKNDATQKELLNALGADRLSEARDQLEEIREKIKQLPKTQTYIASKLYINNEAAIKRDFINNAGNTFGIDCVGNIDLSNPRRVADDVNAWVRENTEGRITSILSAGDISPKTVLFMVNTIYFSGQWEHKFLRARSHDFFGAGGTQTVQMMTRIEHYTYGTSSSLSAQAILIPYRESVANMLVLLPNRRDGLSTLLHQLKRNPELINEIRMEERLVELYLPKFKIETSLDLKVLYEMVGIRHLFDDGYGLKNAVDGMTVRVDKGVHKAIIDVNELGTIAAAASSANGYGSTNPNIDKVVFKADHPFLFFIIAHKQQLFGGTFVAES